LKKLGANGDPVPVSPSNIQAPELTVLVVENEFLVRWTISEFLRERGYEVIEAVSVSDAISVFASGTHVDIVFADLDIPKDPSAPDLALWLDQDRPDVSLLLTHSAAHEADTFPSSAKRRFL
jgi:CheY-like chemotaxis protein